MSPQTARRSVRAIGALAIVAFAVALGLTFGDTTSSAEDLPFIVLMAIGLALFTSIGLAIASRAPENPIGWLYAAVGVCTLTNIAMNEYAIRATTNLDLPGVEYAQFVSSLMIVPAAGAIILALLLFPTGSPPSPRWRVVGWLVGVGCGVAVVAGSLQPTFLEVGDSMSVRNPLQVPAIASFTWLGIAATLLLVGAATGAAGSLAVRFLRSSGEERQQVRWLLFAVGLVMATLLLTFAVGDSGFGNFVFLMLTASILVGLPAATAVAVLRYRLYDLDLVIKKTVIFAITVVLVMIAGVGTLLVISGPLTDLAPDETQAVGVTGLMIGVLIWPMWRFARRIGDRIVYGGRATPYEALSEFSERLSEAYATDDVLPRMAAVLGENTRAAEARVWLRVGNTFRPAAAWPADAASAEPVPGAGDELPALPGDRAVEVRHRGELLGALSAVSRTNDPIDSGRTSLMRDLAAQAGLVLRNVRLIEELRASRQRLVAAQDEERRRLERNIHDGAQQQLVALGVKLRLAEALVDRDSAKTHEMLEQLQTETQGAIDDLRDLARGIYPPLLADRGLEAALEAQARKSATPVDVAAAGLGRYGQDVEAAVYFSCLEALQNVSKYAAASRARIDLAQHNGSLDFVVADDGTGFDQASVTHGSGLQGMTDRIDAIGGSLTIESAPGAGTTVRGSVPV
ncbi:MAG: histidine kinase [Actinomycetota bacterium]